MNMQSIIFILFISIGIFAFTPDFTAEQKDKDLTTLRSVDYISFKKGEFLEYNASYGYLNAAKATIEILPESKIINSRPTMHVVGKAKSLGTFNWFFKVEDRYETYIDEEAILPWKFIRHVREGNYKLDRSITFDHFNNKATVVQKETETYNISANTQDMLSAFYYIRTLDLEKAEIGKSFTINTFFDKEMYPMKIKYLGKEKIETDLGEFKCLKFRPIVEEGRVFKEEEDMTIWISDDANKVPIRLETDLVIGSIKLDLVDYKNLSVPLNIVKD
jgi:hypothetical protein